MSDTITWLSGVERFDANPAATVALDRARWEALGATFVEVDDGDDETPGLAVGRVDGLDFGVLDYGEGETYLLVPGSGLASQETVAVLTALQGHHVLDLGADLIDVAGAAPVDDPGALAARLAAVEHRLSMLDRPAQESLFGAVAEVAEMYPAASASLIHDIGHMPFGHTVIKGQLPLLRLDDVEKSYVKIHGDESGVWRAYRSRRGALRFGFLKGEAAEIPQD